MNRKILYLLLCITVVFWGTSFAAVKIGIGDMAPVQFTFLRTLFAVMIFSVMISRKPKEERQIDKKDIPHIAYIALMGVAGHFIVQYTAIQYTTTVNASLILGIAPILVAIYSSIFDKEKLGINRIIGIVMCVLGIFLTITRGRWSFESMTGHLFGDMLMIMNAFMLASFSISSKKMLEKYDPFILVAYMHMIALVMLIPVSFIPNFLAPHPLWMEFDHMNMKTILSALYLALTCTIIGYYIWYKGIKAIGASRTIMFNYINPLVASLMSFMLFDEDITVYTLLGGLSIIGGVAMNNLEKPYGKVQNVKG